MIVDNELLTKNLFRDVEWVRMSIACNNHGFCRLLEMNQATKPIQPSITTSNGLNYNPGCIVEICLYYLVHFHTYAKCKYVHAVILVGGFNLSEKIVSWEYSSE